LLLNAIESGTSENAIFTCLAIGVNAGALPAFYVFYANGLLVGSIILIAGIYVTAISCWMLFQCAAHYNAGTCEEIALKAYGKNASVITSVLMILTQIGFVTAYIVFLKTLLPPTLESMFHIHLPSLISSGIVGQTVWAFVFSFFVILPLSLPR